MKRLSPFFIAVAIGLTGLLLFGSSIQTLITLAGDVTGPQNATVVAAINVQCYDSNAADTGASGAEFVCSTSPSYAPAAGSLILFRFAAAGNAATPRIKVNGLGIKFIKFADQGINFSPPPANIMLGDATAVNFYPLIYNGTSWVIQQNPPVNVAAIVPNAPTTNGIAYSRGTGDLEGSGLLNVDTGCTIPGAGSISCTAAGSFATYNTATNCSNGASPAVCGSASSGAVAIPTGTVSVSLQINTTAVTANSRIRIQTDDSVTIAATICNSTLATLVGGVAVTARNPGVSFTVTFSGTIAANPLCITYDIKN